MHTWLKVSLEARQRVSLGQGSERAFLTTTHPVIPGSVMRGALAAAWVTGGGKRDATFRQIFEKSRFSAAIPEGVSVIGQSVRQCKYHRGDSHDHDQHHDEALAGPLPVDQSSRCGGRPYARGGYRPERIVTVTSTALQQGKHVAAEGRLFSRQVLEAGTRFTADIVAYPGIELERLTSLTTVFVGGRSGVMGRCDVTIEVHAGPRMPEDGEEVAVLRTRSPALLVDAAGVPCVDFKRALTEVGLDVLAAWGDRIESATAGGWHLASGLPKPTEVGVAPGATAKVVNPGRNKLMDVLAVGLGVRRNEGYGWLDLVTSVEAPGDAREPEVGVDERHSSDALGSWQGQIKALALNDRQRQWLAGRLRLRRAGHTLTDDEWNEPGLARLSTPQRERLESIVRDVPQDERNSLAFALKKGGVS